MSKIRKSAKGKDCDVRLPGVCNFDSETVVAAHIRIAGLAGVGMKPSDLATVRACSSCHAVIDGHAKAPHLTREQIQLYTLEGHLRTLVAYEREGIVSAK